MLLQPSTRTRTARATMMARWPMLGIEGIVSKWLDPQCRLDHQRFGSKIRAKPCAVRKTGIRERLGFATAGDRDTVECREGQLPRPRVARAKGCVSGTSRGGVVVSLVAHR